MKKFLYFAFYTTKILGENEKIVKNAIKAMTFDRNLCILTRF
jgi:hypothetical protein